MTSAYTSLLAHKTRRAEKMGPAPGAVHPMLFAWQRTIVEWAVRGGRAGIFADCGLGKTLMQIEWARLVGGPVLIVAPLAVGAQTIAEAARIGVIVSHAEAPASEIVTINYERIHKLDPGAYKAIVLDESSILKSVDGKIRTRLLREWVAVPYRLCCTATPAPNDVAEMANHAEFLGACSRAEMLAEFFVHDDEGWRLKGHARDAFWRWIAEWAVFVRRPSDIGHADDGYALPELRVCDEVVPAGWRPAGKLFADADGGVRGRLDARRGSIDARVARAVEIVRSRPGPWLVWCGLNAESSRVAEMLGAEAVEISGADDEDVKVAKHAAWRHGEARVLVTKARIFGFGMNWQHCGQMVFLGLGDSYEQYYQAIRRCWRFGRTEPVDAIVVISDAETGVAANVRRKESENAVLAEEVIRAVREHQTNAMAGTSAGAVDYREDEASGDGWRLLLGDCVERLREIADDSIGLSVFSPPFAALYTYSASPRDMGNSRGFDDFFAHFRLLVPELLRVTMPCRRACVHVAQVSTTAATHGVIGWRDFRAEIVREFVAGGWVYDGEVVIDKDPQAQAIRTHSKALLFAQKERDAAWLRPAMADYILLFRKPGENPQPVKTDVDNEEWIRWARPIWYGIDETDTLNAAESREEKDERHICPLQLGVIERCVRLWSNAGDIVLDPFAGIGSTGYVALRHERRFVGVELKEAYWRCANKNLDAAARQLSLFSSSST